MNEDQPQATRQDLLDLEQRLSGAMLRLITDLKDSLERQILSGFEDMAGRFDTQSTRLDRQAALIQTGSRWTNRMNEWAESIDSALARKDQELAELRSRIEKLERKQPPEAHQ